MPESAITTNCAGVLAPPLADVLQEQLDVSFPYHLSRGKIPGDVLHAAGQEICLKDTAQPAVALRRVQFDAYMLETAVQRGIHLLAARAVDLEFHADCVTVYTESAPLEGDVLVGAFGSVYERANIPDILFYGAPQPRVARSQFLMVSFLTNGTSAIRLFLP